MIGDLCISHLNRFESCSTHYFTSYLSCRPTRSCRPERRIGLRVWIRRPVLPHDRQRWLLSQVRCVQGMVGEGAPKGLGQTHKNDTAREVNACVSWGPNNPLTHPNQLIRPANDIPVINSASNPKIERGHLVTTSSRRRSRDVRVIKGCLNPCDI